MSRDSTLSVNVVGLWALWRVLGVGVQVETTIDRLRELGIPRATAYRRLREFRSVTGCQWPNQITGDELIDLLRRRQQLELPMEAADVG